MAKQKDIITRTAEAPAELLAQTIVASQVVRDKTLAAADKSPVIKRSKQYWHMLGPGLTTGASDDDPSGIATYSQTGAQFGYQFLWLSFWTFPLMSIVQEMCARIGLVTGRGLAGNIRVYFNKRVLYVCTVLLFVANTINIGANLGAMAKAVQLLNPQFNFTASVIAFAVVSLGLQIFTPYARYAKYLKWMALVLLSYVLSTILADLNWSEVFRNAFIPKMGLDKESIILLCAILGTTISPYLFFWQTSQEVEEQILMGKITLKLRQLVTPKDDVKRMRIDVWSGMILSNMVMFFIIAACGGILHANGITEITSAAQAAEALRPFAGDATYFLFAIGIIGTGMLAIPVLAGASSYAMAESFRWKEGLYRDLAQGKAFYGVIILSMLIGLAMNFLGIDPIKALIYSAVLNGLVAPVILFLIVRLASNRKIMGRWTNKRYVTWVGWVTTAAMTVSGIAAIYALFA